MCLSLHHIGAMRFIPQIVYATSSGAYRITIPAPVSASYRAVCARGRGPYGGSGSDIRGSGPLAIRQEPDVLCKQETDISSVSNGRRAVSILGWGAPGVKRAAGLYPGL